MQFQCPLSFTNPLAESTWLTFKLKKHCNKTRPFFFFFTRKASHSPTSATIAGDLKPETPRNLRRVHAFVLKTRTFPDPQSLSHSDLSPENIPYFCRILTHLENRDVSIDLCNVILRGICSRINSGDSVMAMVFFGEILGNGFVPDNYTVPFVLKACAQSRAFREGVQIHGYSIKTGLIASNVYVKNTVMRLYAVCGFLNSVRLLFDGSSQRDLVTWTTLVQCYGKTGFAREAVKAFFEMCDANVEADEMTVVVALSACSKIGDLSSGEKIHGYIHDNGVVLDVFVGNALVDMYLNCGDADSARKIFNDMPVRNVITWNSMISGLAHRGEFKDALEMFWRMQNKGVKPDDVTLVCVLNSCANLGLLEMGKWVRVYIDRNRIVADGFIGNALMDMYSKCGSIDQAFRVFEGMKRRDVYTYTAIIVGLAMHGEGQRALAIFSEMPQVRVKPDEVTFIGVLTACSHAGLVAEGKKYFRDMSSVYNLRPQTEHYGCMVDLLGRAGLIEEAEELISSMKIEPDAFVWGALLGACKIHGRVELGEEVMKKLLKVEPERDGAYILMSNIYSSANKWRDAVRLRKEMKVKKVKKTPGCSSIELDGIVYEFRKGDKSHPRSKEMYKLLEEITIHSKNYEHLPRMTV